MLTALVLTAQCVIAITAPAHAHTSAEAARHRMVAPTLTCTVSTRRNLPVTFTPPVGLITRDVTARATLDLTRCSLPGGHPARLNSGRLTAQGTGRASCGAVDRIRGSGRITWYTADGRTAGTSTLRPTLNRISSYNPGDMLLGGQITAGELAGARVSGSATPTSDVSSCALTGLSAVHATGRITFSS